MTKYRTGLTKAEPIEAIKNFPENVGISALEASEVLMAYIKMRDKELEDINEILPFKRNHLIVPDEG